MGIVSSCSWELVTQSEKDARGGQNGGGRAQFSAGWSGRSRSQQRAWNALQGRQDVAQREVERGQSPGSMEKSPEINTLKEWEEVRCVPRLLRHRCP